MKASTWVWIVIVILIIAGGVWWWLSSQNPATAPYSNTSQSTSTSSGNGGNVALGENTSASVGTYLIASNGMTLYTYADDSTGVSNCAGACAQKWPPYTVTSATSLVAESPIGGMLGTIVRADGSLQVTYNGMPLYFYTGDTSPGNTNGEGIGNLWYVAKP
ncbi:MAG: hypothetical protein KGJ34_00380 [Patescibacteria group bacterium]|nr:hypothetical protein [Patescibacteria group bacterium]